MAAEFIGEGRRPAKSVTAKEFTEIYRNFGYGEALARDDASLSYVVELAPHLRLLLVDVNTADPPDTVSAQTLSWVEGQLQNAAEHSAWGAAVSHQNLLAHSRLETPNGCWSFMSGIPWPAASAAISTSRTSQRVPED